MDPDNTMHLLFRLLSFLILVSADGNASGQDQIYAKRAGSQCDRSFFGGTGEKGLGDAPDCLGARRSLPSIQTGEVSLFMPALRVLVVTLASVAASSRAAIHSSRVISPDAIFCCSAFRLTHIGV